MKDQVVQNKVVQAVMDKHNYGHVSSLVFELYWLPVCFWVQFKELVVIQLGRMGKLWVPLVPKNASWQGLEKIFLL